MSRKKEFVPEKALDQAIEVFWRKGYEATTVQDLCQHMNIRPGSLYDTFGDKRRLFMAALNRYIALNNLFPDMGSVVSGKAAIQGIFEALVDISVADKECRGCLVVNAIVELAATDEEFASFSDQRRQDYERLFRTLLNVAQQRHEISFHHNAEALAQYLTNAMFGLRVVAKTTADRKILNNIVNVTLAVLN